MLTIWVNMSSTGKRHIVPSRIWLLCISLLGSHLLHSVGKLQRREAYESWFIIQMGMQHK